MGCQIWAISSAVTPVTPASAPVGSHVASDWSEEFPLAGYAFEYVRAAIFEDNPRAVHQVLDGVGHEDLSGLRQGGDAGPDVDGDPSDVVTTQLTLAGVQAASNVDTQFRYVLGEFGGTAERTWWGRRRWPALRRRCA